MLQVLRLVSGGGAPAEAVRLKSVARITIKVAICTHAAKRRLVASRVRSKPPVTRSDTAACTLQGVTKCLFEVLARLVSG